MATKKTSYLLFFFKKSIIYQATSLLLLSFIIGLVVNFFRPEGIHLFQKWDKKLQKKTTEELPRLTLQEFRGLMGKSHRIIIDARDKDFYEEGHIPDALNLPLTEIETLLPDFLSKTPIYTPLITYCEGFGCDMSLKLALILQDAGFTTLMVYTGGMEEWESNGLPVEKGLKNHED